VRTSIEVAEVETGAKVLGSLLLGARPAEPCLGQEPSLKRTTSLSYIAALPCTYWSTETINTLYRL
jgi:hypothetical protein